MLDRYVYDQVKQKSSIEKTGPEEEALASCVPFVSLRASYVIRSEHLPLE